MSGQVLTEAERELYDALASMAAFDGAADSDKLKSVCKESSALIRRLVAIVEAQRRVVDAAWRVSASKYGGDPVDCLRAALSATKEAT